MDSAIPCLHKGLALGSIKLAAVLGIVTVFIWQIMCYVLKPNVEYCWNRVTFVLKDDRWPGAWSDCSFDPHTHTHKLYIKTFPPVFLSTHCTL